MKIGIREYPFMTKPSPWHMLRLRAFHWFAVRVPVDTASDRRARVLGPYRFRFLAMRAAKGAER